MDVLFWQNEQALTFNIFMTAGNFSIPNATVMMCAKVGFKAG